MTSFQEQDISKKRDLKCALLPLILACLLIIAGPASLNLGTVNVVRGNTQSTTIKAALNWLSAKWEQDGSFGKSQIITPAAAYAMWLNDSSSSKANQSFKWLASQLDNSSSYAWGEADIPGQILYSLHATGNIGLLQNASDYKGVLAYQDTGGGFIGYYGPNGPVASSVDTAFALWGLIGTHSLNDTSTANATDYLLRLQNKDGSFNLTRTKSSDSFDSLGPEPVSTTALVILALKQASFQTSDSHILKALGFLATAASTNFTTTQDHEGHVYGASLSALAFQAYSQTADLASAIKFIQSEQNITDGGFRDPARFSRGSNALDTGWATVALQEALQSSQPEQSPSLPGSWITLAIIGIAVATAVLGVFILVRRSRNKVTSGSEASVKIASK